MSIQFNQVSYIYQQGTPYEFEAIKDISLTLEPVSYTHLTLPTKA